MQFKTLLTLGRVSNLPTIWTNVLAAAVLAQASLLSSSSFGFNLNMLPDHSLMLWLGTLVALSLMYLGGMFLNDAFDADWDQKNNNLRPIVAGDVSAKSVWIIGSALMLVAVMLISYLYRAEAVAGASSWYEGLYGFLAALLLALTIIAYNAWHKQFAHSAFIMGACRFGVYLVGALLLAELNLMVTLAALSLLLYIAGLTYLARHEHANRVNRLWPLLLLFTPVAVAAFFGYDSGYDSGYFWVFLLIFVAWVVSRLRFVIGAEKPNVGACIGGLLAAIPLLDGLMLASVKAVIPSLICLLVFLTIPRLHRWISGT